MKMPLAVCALAFTFGCSGDSLDKQYLCAHPSPNGDWNSDRYTWLVLENYHEINMTIYSRDGAGMACDAARVRIEFTSSADSLFFKTVWISARPSCQEQFGERRAMNPVRYQLMEWNDKRIIFGRYPPFNPLVTWFDTLVRKD